MGKDPVVVLLFVAAIAIVAVVIAAVYSTGI